MVVDNDQAFAEELREFLNSSGHSVTIADNGGEAVEYFRRLANPLHIWPHSKAEPTPIDLVITSQIMPWKTGLEVLMDVKHLGKTTLVGDVRVWLMSHDITETLKSLAERNGAEKVVSKMKISEELRAAGITTA